jgi:hypothetical protein
MAWSKAIPNYWPRFRSQLGKGTPVPGATRGSKDCNVRAFQHAFGQLTKDKFVPWVDNIRIRMGRPGPTGTTLWNSQKAAATYDAALKQRGRKPIRVYMKYTKDGVKKAVRNKAPVCIAIDYGQFNKQMSRTGDPNFTGGHGIMVLGEKKWNDGTIVWKLYDSLDDNRRNSIPQGPRWVPRYKVLKAAEVWARKTNNTEVVAGVFRGGGAL